METSDSPQMQRSISMPSKPSQLETKRLKRSDEKEVVYEENHSDASSETPGTRSNLTTSAPQMSTTNTRSPKVFPNRSSTDIPYQWAGSTIELNVDMRRNTEYDLLPYRKRAYRVIEKNGRENVIFRRIPEKSWRFIRDFVTTLIELDWKYMLTMFVGSYFFSWFFFAVLCYMVSYYHGDLNFNTVTGERLGEGQAPCIKGVYNFLSVLIYSIETQTTVGFGEKYPTEECPETIFLFIAQIIVSIAIEGGMISIIYAKTARPAKQLTKLKFSDKAVICYRDGILCLLFRVCDLRQQQTIESKIRVFMLMDLPTNEGEVIKTHTELKLQGNGQQIIIWPETVCHVIDETSPLYRFTSAKEFNAAQFELYVSIVGVSPATGQITEARTSYVPREVFWGQRFINIIHYDAVNERYNIDHRNFNTTISVDMMKESVTP